MRNRLSFQWRLFLPASGARFKNVLKIEEPEFGRHALDQYVALRGFWRSLEGVVGKDALCLFPVWLEEVLCSFQAVAALLRRPVVEKVICEAGVILAVILIIIVVMFPERLDP